MVDIDQLPLYEMHTMYYMFSKEKEAESKLTDEEKAGVAMSRMIEDNI